jgi:hypothetical protein
LRRVAGDLRRYLEENLSPSLSPQERGTDSDSIGISENLSPSFSPREKGTDSDSMGISVRTSLLALFFGRKGHIQILLAFRLGHGASPSPGGEGFRER